MMKATNRSRRFWSIAGMPILFVLASIGTCRPVHAQTPVFDDEFTGSSLDTAKWFTETIAGKGQGTFRAEPVFFKPEGVTVGDHTLHISVERVQNVDPKTGVVYPLRTGRIQSKESFLYGKFEFRAKLPRGAGLWSAIWMRTPYGKPFNGEIDILEGHGSHPNLIQSTMHPWVNGVEPRHYCAWLLVQPKPDDPKFHQPNCERIDNTIHLASDLASDYHNYTVEWLPGKITWSLDGQPYYTVTDMVPQVPMTIVLSLTFSHNWDGGSPDTTQLPQSLDVKYVRVYPMAK
jgi:beta-glucanase (GH16 family)